MNSTFYQKVLKENVPLFVCDFKLLQQDNDPKPRADPSLNVSEEAKQRFWRGLNKCPD